ncbi:hypothetical protein CHUAL_012602 [Chamberlinius hualienensis]
MGIKPSGKSTSNAVLPEAILNTVEIISFFGFPVENHTVLTPDGYILEIHRIPNNSTLGQQRFPVILQHGLQCSSGAWVVNGAEDSLAFVLARKGFDVWISNVRGNRYGRKHAILSPESQIFWDFNIDHFALIDLPTITDYVLHVTGHQKINYIGHSMGSTMILALLSAKPQYNEKFNFVMLQAPVYFARFIRSPLRLLHVYMEELQKWWRELKKTDELLRSSTWQRKIIQNLCSSYPTVILCEIFFFVVFGYDEVLSNRKRMHVYLSHCPSGMSFQVFMHFAQTFRSGIFKHYDYGPKLNMVKYNQKTPPDYNLANVIAPTAIFWSYMDSLTDREDVYQLAQQLPNLQLLEKVPFELFAHQDFQFGINATFHHYQKVIDVLLNPPNVQQPFEFQNHVDICGLRNWP